MLYKAAIIIDKCGTPEVKIARQIDALEHLQVSVLICVADSDRFAGNVEHGRFFDFVNVMKPYRCHWPPFSYQDHVIAFHEFDEA